ncbi:MAG: hypothetical protein IT336_10655 [Thermomicrobiales bacterium]|nr:hypothetical protein [Thermomicrobiales bacterium]
MSQPPAMSPSSSVPVEIATLRERLRLIDEIDRGTVEMVERLAEAVRGSAEVRAQATLEIAGAIDRLERTILARDAAQRDALLALHQEVAAAHTRAMGVGAALSGLERELTGLQARFDEPQAETSDEPPAAGETVASMPPLPAASSFFIEVEQVPSAGAALSIQRFVSELPGVVAATTREYAAGLLRLEVRARGECDPSQLGRWPGGRLELAARDGDALLFRVVD